MAKPVNLSTAADVRAWAVENEHTVGKRGKFSRAVVKAYNAAHKSNPYVEGAPEVTLVKVAALDARQRPFQKPVRVPTSETRAWAVAQGLTVKSAGRLPRSVIVQHAQALAVASGVTLAPEPVDA